MYKKIIMENRKIIIPTKIILVFCVLNDTKFLAMHNTIGMFYLIAPESLYITREEDVLSITVKEESENSLVDLNKFCDSLNLNFKTLGLVYKKKLILKGLGFRVKVSEDKKKIECKLGYSHLIELEIPKNIRVKAKKTLIQIEGMDKDLLGNFVNKIVSLKVPDSYKGKGF